MRSWLDGGGDEDGEGLVGVERRAGASGGGYLLKSRSGLAEGRSLERATVGGSVMIDL